MEAGIKHEKPRLGEGIFTASDVAGILKIDTARARYLINQYLNNKLKDQQAFQYRIETSGNYAVNFHALIEIFVFDKLRKLGVSSQKIVKFHDYLAKKYKSHYPFAATKFLLSGRELYFEFGGEWVTGDERLQIGFKEIVEFLGDKIEYDKRKNIARQYYPLGKSRSIVVDPDYRFGQPIIANTNLMAENVYDLYLAEDRNKEFVANLYKLSIEQVNDVIEYMAA